MSRRGSTMDSEAGRHETAQRGMLQALRHVFGFSRFRPNQERLVRALLARRDVFGVMPTGGGKSLCYQLPAHLLPGTCVVVSPLISLMKDQVDALRSRGLTAEYVNSSLEREEQAAVMQRLLAGTTDLLYVAPERLAIPGFAASLQKLPVALFAIDEAHCISEWGHDFRPDYLELGKVLKQFPGTPVAAFTATATMRVQEQIVDKLGLRDPLTIRASFDRPNLFYEVAEKDHDLGQALKFVRRFKGQSGIVYRTSRKSVEETARFLAQHGVRALPYHAGMGKKGRAEHQEAFIQGRCRVIVATIAFGMGIDKPDVRFILHADLPRNLSGYYQETGRAGRDGKPAHCLLLFGRGDISKIRYFIRKIGDTRERGIAEQKLQNMVAFANTARCRRYQLLRHFGESYRRRNCRTCDVCRHAGRAIASGDRGSARSPGEWHLAETVLITWRLLREGLAYRQVARERRMAESTVIGHIERLVSTGMELNLNDCVATDRRRRIEALFASHGLEKLRPVVEAAKGSVTYADARLVRAQLMQRQAASMHSRESRSTRIRQR